MAVEENGDDNENIRVVVRCRPISQDEAAAGHKVVVTTDAVQRTVAVKDPESSAMKTLTFDGAFGPDSTQPDVFNQVARPIIDNVLKGYNGTIFAYGQTGSGKTFTMEGVSSRPELRGIIPNAFAHIFGHIAREKGNKNFLVRVSYFEIYKEQIRDLLSKKADGSSSHLEVKEDRDRGVYVKGLSEQVVHSADDLDKIMAVGKRNRMTASTKMNLQSSRSHAIFTITIEKSERRPDGRLHICVGKLNLVDLAGSERQSKTEATDERLKEASKINHGLSTLGNVIAALTDGRSSHVPYRNSKLTRILQDSLGGNSKTVMIANVGPASYNFDETTNTLRYATRAKYIKNVAKINEDPKDAVLRRMEEEIEQLRRQLNESPGYADANGQIDPKERLRQQEERRKKQEARKGHLQKMQAEIQAQKEELERNTAITEVERTKILDDIEEKEAQLQATEKERQTLLKKLKKLEKTIIVGGENLLDKAEAQEKLLEDSKRTGGQEEKEEDLRRTLLDKQTERNQIEERYATLQEIAAAKSLEAGRLKQQILSIKSDIEELREENRIRQDEAVVSVKETDKNIRLYQKIIDRFLPKEMQRLIEQNCAFNEDIGEWEVKCLAFTGPMQQSRKGSEKSLSYAEALEDSLQRNEQRKKKDWEKYFKSLKDDMSSRS